MSLEREPFLCLDSLLSDQPRFLFGSPRSRSARLWAPRGRPHLRPPGLRQPSGRSSLPRPPHPDLFSR